MDSQALSAKEVSGTGWPLAAGAGAVLDGIAVPLPGP
jgi:hypothetical protein